MEVQPRVGILKRMSNINLVEIQRKDKGVGVDMMDEKDEVKEAKKQHHFSTSKKATVEVTVKVKKRRQSSSRDQDHPTTTTTSVKTSEVFPKGK